VSRRLSFAKNNFVTNVKTLQVINQSKCIFWFNSRVNLHLFSKITIIEQQIKENFIDYRGHHIHSQTCKGQSITSGLLPDSGAYVNLLLLTTAAQLGFRSSTLPAGPSLADGSKLNTVGFMLVDILYNGILIKDVQFLISCQITWPIVVFPTGYFKW